MKEVKKTSVKDKEKNEKPVETQDPIPNNAEVKTQQIRTVAMLPCSELNPFSLKENSDFSEWPAEKFETLVISIREFGVLHPIIVRNTTEEGKYEILAGEHRWKACSQLELPTIPAYIVEDCDDDKAKSIFMITNVISRDLTLKDKIYGWSMYYNLTKGKSEKTIKQLQEEGLIQKIESSEVSKRYIFRFKKISTLHPVLLELVEKEVIKILEAEQLSSLSKEQQKLLSEYADRIVSNSIIKNVLLLNNNEIEGKSFDKEGLDFIFSVKFTESKPVSYSDVVGNARTILKQYIKKEDYGNSKKILTDAFSMYNQYNGRKSLVKKAMLEYLKTHPEDEAQLPSGWHLED